MANGVAESSPSDQEIETTEFGGKIYSAWPRDEFFAIKRSQAVDLSYGDVRVATGPSDIEERDVVLASRFARGIELKVPLVSAAMDTVTESEMAITLAMLGGLGVLHAGLSSEETKKQVRDIKYKLTSAAISNPRTVSPDRTLESILNDCKKNNWPFRSFPVTGGNGAVIGMLSGKVFKYKRFVLGDTTAEQAMVPFEEMAHGEPGMTVREAYKIMEEREVGAVPLLNKDRTPDGMYLWADIENIISGDAANFSVDDKGRLLAVIAVSTHQEEIERISTAMGDDHYLDGVVVDTSHGDGKYAVPMIRLIKEAFPELRVVGGNVDEPEGALKVANAGADGVKVGKGPGSICITRMEIGIGCPQVTAIYNCVEALRGMDIPVCADGGITNNGDLNVAIATGADSIMMGGMFAATKETPGARYKNKDGLWVKSYRGMGSVGALSDKAMRAGRDRYGQVLGTTLAPEGEEFELNEKGPVTEVFQRAATYLRRGMASYGSKTVEAHRQNARFRFHTDAGVQESRPHEVG